MSLGMSHAAAQAEVRALIAAIRKAGPPATWPQTDVQTGSATGGCGQAPAAV